jgi:hypothetical protein
VTVALARISRGEQLYGELVAGLAVHMKALAALGISSTRSAGVRQR